ncbi:MAG: YbaB/EbfC family nucleoid-associated protein [Elusimicrobiota bacterium]|nr:YbaB/EbfC family nucleoid-associated protein [Elusimicrobiota bacterium]
MFDKMKDLWEMKKKMEDMKKELDVIVLASEDDLVKVDITGSQEIKAVTIKADLSFVDKAKLETSITETVNRAIGESQKTAASKMGGMGLKLPGM